MMFIGMVSDVVLGKVKTILVIVSALTSITLGGYGFIMKKQNDKLNVENRNLQDYNTILTTENVTYKNAAGQTVTKTIQYQRDVSDLRHSKDSMEIQIYRVIEASRLKEKQLRDAYAINITAVGGGALGEEFMVEVDNPDSSLLIPDSIPVRPFDDGFLSVLIYPDSLTYTYEENLTLLKAERWDDRKFFLWRWINWKKKTNRDLVEVVSSNPNATQKVRFIKLDEND